MYLVGEGTLLLKLRTGAEGPAFLVNEKLVHFRFLFCFVLDYVCLCMGMGMCMWCTWKPEGVGSPVAEVTGTSPASTLCLLVVL